MSSSINSSSLSLSTSGSSTGSSSSEKLLISTSISSIGASFLSPNPTLRSFYKGLVKSVGLSIKKPEFNKAILNKRSAYSDTSLLRSSSSEVESYFTLFNISLITG